MNAPQRLSLSIKMPAADRRLETYSLSAPRDFPIRRQHAFNRVAYAAAHVVADPLAAKDISGRSDSASPRRWTPRSAGWGSTGRPRSS